MQIARPCHERPRGLTLWLARCTSLPTGASTSGAPKGSSATLARAAQNCLDTGTVAMNFFSQIVAFLVKLVIISLLIGALIGAWLAHRTSVVDKFQLGPAISIATNAI
jgi:hypothetical protein